jgi:dTMP kinase
VPGPAPPGRFVTFEGGEGVGKSTQVERLRGRLGALGREVVVTREPGGSPRAEAIRASILAGRAKPFGPLAEAALFSAARADHLDRLIRPALARGAVVLCDRFADSTRAYQGALGDLDARLIRALERVVVGDTRPDLTILLDAPAQTGLARARRRWGGAAADRFEAEEGAFHERLRRAFLDLAAAEPGRFVVVDADRPPEAVEDEVWAAVEGRLLGALQEEARHGR